MGRLRSGAGPWGWEGGGGKEDGEGGGRSRGLRENRGRYADILRSLLRGPGSEAEHRRKAGRRGMVPVCLGWVEFGKTMASGLQVGAWIAGYPHLAFQRHVWPGHWRCSDRGRLSPWEGEGKAPVTSPEQEASEPPSFPRKERERAGFQVLGKGPNLFPSPAYSEITDFMAFAGSEAALLKLRP